MICITNKGVVTPEAFTLLGASSKRGDESKIGMFGSGNKYAIAVLLRNNISFRIFAGLDEIKIKTRKIKFQDQTFMQIGIGHRYTSLTTSMGPDWQVWFAVREIIANAKDEGHYKLEQTDTVEAEDGKTKIYIDDSHSQIQNLINHPYKYFLEESEHPISSTSSGEIYEAVPDNELIIYRKGIRCNEVKTPMKSLFRYNINRFLDINESRTYKHEYQVHSRVENLIASTTNPAIIEKYISNRKGHFEEKLDFSFITDYSKEWQNILQGKRICPSSYYNHAGFPIEDKLLMVELPDEMCINLAKLFPDLHIVGSKNSDFQEVEATDEEKHIISSAVSILTSYKIHIKSSIKVAIFKLNDTVGCYEKSTNTIALARQYLQDIDTVVETIYEEYLHSEGLRHGTRSFEEHLIKQNLNLMKQLQEAKAASLSDDLILEASTLEANK